MNLGSTGAQISISFPFRSPLAGLGRSVPANVSINRSPLMGLRGEVQTRTFHLRTM